VLKTATHRPASAKYHGTNVFHITEEGMNHKKAASAGGSFTSKLKNFVIKFGFKKRRG
jgi:hypothetical protein